MHEILKKTNGIILELQVGLALESKAVGSIKYH